MSKKDKNKYFTELNNKYHYNLERLIEYYGIDGEFGHIKEFKNDSIKDSVDDLFRILFSHRRIHSNSI